MHTVYQVSNQWIDWTYKNDCGLKIFVYQYQDSCSLLQIRIHACCKLAAKNITWYRWKFKEKRTKRWEPRHHNNKDLYLRALAWKFPTLSVILLPTTTMMPPPTPQPLLQSTSGKGAMRGRGAPKQEGHVAPGQKARRPDELVRPAVVGLFCWYRLPALLPQGQSSTIFRKLLSFIFTIHSFTMARLSFWRRFAFNDAFTAIRIVHHPHSWFELTLRGDLFDKIYHFSTQYYQLDWQLIENTFIIWKTLINDDKLLRKKKNHCFGILKFVIVFNLIIREILKQKYGQI